MNSSFSGIYLTQKHWDEMEDDVVAKSPEEACGFVVGQHAHSQMILPVTNILHDPYRFRMDPAEQLKAMIMIEEQGLDLLAIYHSHPHGIYYPSVTDHEELSFPGIIYLIWYQDADEWKCRGYLMQAQSGTGEMPVMISTNE